MDIKENDKVKQYLNNVCSQIKFKEVHKDIVAELKDHIQSFAEDNMENNMPEEAAIDKALSQMGDPHLIGKQLHTIHKPEPEWGILLFTLFFSIFGLVTMYFLETNKAVYNKNFYFPIFQNSLVSYLIGISIMIALYFFDYRKLFKYSKPIYFITLFILIFTCLFCRTINGVPYIGIGSTTINFISISPIFLIIAFAGIFENWNWRNIKSFILGILLLFIPCFFMLRGSLFSLIIYVFTCLIIMYASKAKVSHICVIIGGLVSTITLYLLTEPYRTARLLDFFNPSKDPKGSGWLYFQLKNAVSSAGILGNGFTFKTNSIPEIHSDFVLTYIVYTFGWVTAAILIMLIVFFIARIYKITNKTKDTYGKLLINGFSSIFFTKFLFNILVNLGLSPTVSVSLPFISYGRYELLSNMIMIGLILSVYRRRTLSPISSESQSINFYKYKNSYIHKLIMEQWNNNMYENHEFNNASFVECNLSNAEIKNCNISGLKVNGISVEKLLEDYNNKVSK